MTDQSLDSFSNCSTTRDDWRDQTEIKLFQLGLYFVEAHPGVISILPKGQLVGGVVNGVKVPHIVVAKTLRESHRHYFECYHDPSGRLSAGEMIHPYTVVLLAKLDKV